MFAADITASIFSQSTGTEQQAPTKPPVLGALGATGLVSADSTTADAVQVAIQSNAVDLREDGARLGGDGVALEVRAVPGANNVLVDTTAINALETRASIISQLTGGQPSAKPSAKPPTKPPSEKCPLKAYLDSHGHAMEYFTHFFRAATAESNAEHYGTMYEPIGRGPDEDYKRMSSQIPSHRLRELHADPKFHRHAKAIQQCWQVYNGRLLQRSFQRRPEWLGRVLRHETFLVRGRALYTKATVHLADAMLNNWIEDPPSWHPNRTGSAQTYWDRVAERPRRPKEHPKEKFCKPIAPFTRAEAIGLLNGVRVEDREKLANARLDEGCILWRGKTAKRGNWPIFTRQAADTAHGIALSLSWCPKGCCDRAGRPHHCSHGAQDKLRDAVERLPSGAQLEEAIQQSLDPALATKLPDGGWTIKLRFNMLEPGVLDWFRKQKFGEVSVETTKTERKHPARKGNINVAYLLLNAYVDGGFRMLDTRRSKDGPGYGLAHTCGNAACVNPAHLKVVVLERGVKRKR